MDLSSVLNRAREMRDSGATEADIQAMVEHSFPPSPVYNTPIANCHACLDRKRVEIWHPKEVARHLHSKPIDDLTYLCVVDCKCHPTSQSQVRYDSSKHCRVVPWHSVSQKRQTLLDWLAERQKIENNPRYDSSFSEFV